MTKKLAWFDNPPGNRLDKGTSSATTASQATNAGHPSSNTVSTNPTARPVTASAVSTPIKPVIVVARKTAVICVPPVPMVASLDPSSSANKDDHKSTATPPNNAVKQRNSQISTRHRPTRTPSNSVRSLRRGREFLDCWYRF